MAPVKALAAQFVRRSPMALLAIGLALSVFDFATLYAAAATEGVLHIKNGIGLLNNFGLLSTLVGNAVSLYVAKKFYDDVCSIRISKAVISSSTNIEKELSILAAMVKMRGRYRFLIYGFISIGTMAWLSNVSGHVFDNPQVRWGHKVFDSLDHPLTFTASRLHNIYTWMIIVPFLAHVMIYCSFQLKKTLTAASGEGALTYDVLNPDQRGGFAFVDNANILFNIVAALTYIQVTLHIETFEKMNPEHVIAYVTLTVILIMVNRLFLGDIYVTINTLRLEALNKVKNKVYRDDKLSFDILKYCYERRISVLSVTNLAIKAAAIVIPGLVKAWPSIVRVLKI